MKMTMPEDELQRLTELCVEYDKLCKELVQEIDKDSRTQFIDKIEIIEGKLHILKITGYDSSK